MRDPNRLGPRYFAERDEIEAAWAADPVDSQAAFAEGDRLLARWTADVLSQRGGDVRPWYVRRYWAKRNARAGLRLERARAGYWRKLRATKLVAT